MQLEDHPLSELFALHDGQPLKDLAEDIKAHGQRQDIILFEGRILDGRRRYRACRLAGVEPHTCIFPGTEDEARELVMSLNFHRRHSTVAELAFAASRYATIRRPEKSSPSRPGPEDVTLEKAAETFQVSHDSVKRARILENTAPPEVVAAMRNGEVTINDAYRTRKWTHEQQLEALQKLRAGEAQSMFSAAIKGDACEDEFARDAVGTPIPEQAREAFALARQFLAVYVALQQQMDQVKRLREGPAGRLLSESLTKRFQELRAAVKSAMPTHVCPYCQGNKPDCECCQGQGWTGKDVYEAWEGKP